MDARAFIADSRFARKFCDKQSQKLVALFSVPGLSRWVSFWCGRHEATSADAFSYNEKCGHHELKVAARSLEHMWVVDQLYDLVLVTNIGLPYPLLDVQ